MKPTIKTLVLGASVLAIGLGAASVSNPAYAANQGNSEFVKNVDIDFVGAAPVINIVNTAADKHVSKVKPTVQGNSISIGIDGYVECKSQNNVDMLSAHAYFGGVGIGGFGQLATQGTLHNEEVDVAYKTKADNIPEATEDTFNVPLNKIKQGHPALRVDPLEELEKARQAFNGTDLEFYKQDREIVVQRPISLGAVCGKLKNQDKRSVGFETKNTTIKIKYKGDTALKNFKLNAQLNNNLPNQVQVGDQPLKITSMSFQPNMPHHIGACPGSKTIRVNYQGQGDGDIKIRVTDGGQTIYQSGPIAFSGGGQKHHDFDIGVPAAQPADLNKTVSHDLKVHVVEKDDDEQVWPAHYQLKDQAEWKHRCTPQLNGQLQGGNNGGIGGYNNADEAPTLKLNKIQAQPVKPKRAKISN